MKCWQCGVEPAGVADVRTLGETEPRYVATAWPKGDHEHAALPPTPSELAAAADAAQQRRLALWAE